ncbi:hypothetical protein U9M48_014248 [Paspalum notatum var. saurae]|uniref:PUM-HD domain-containing protein n=1 Tax=Paspalum notatum var. saurae TaxID=547442 RepID=A0AAQ3T2A8_PASNO
MTPQGAEGELERWGGVGGDDEAPSDGLMAMLARLDISGPETAMPQPLFAGPSSARRPMNPVPMGMPLSPRGRGVLDEQLFVEGRLHRGGLAHGPRNYLGVDMPPPRTGATAATRGILPYDPTYMPPPPPPPPPQPYLHGGTVALNPNLVSPWACDERALLLALSQETPETIVSYACDLLESRPGQRLFRLVLDHCNHQLREWVVAEITRDRESFRRLCSRRPDEAVFIINSSKTRRSSQLLGYSMVQWMAHDQIQDFLSDSKRIRVMQAFIVTSPPDIAQVIFEVVAKNCIRLACHPNGLSLLQDCLERVSWKQMDDIFTQISYKSLHLAQNSCGNWIVQNVLMKRDPSHCGIIASCLRNHYVTLAKNKYGSNVVECCLRVFNEILRLAIVNEFIRYPHFRDLVTDQFANFALSTALETCKVNLV